MLVFASQAISAEDTVCLPPQLQVSGSVPAENSEYFEHRFATAEQLRLSAAAAGAEWLETEALLLGSRKLAANGNWSAAQQLVYKACFQAETALQQAAYEAEAWKGRVIE